MRRALLWACLLVAALPSAAQSIRLTLIDHIVGSDLVHNAPLPAGTDVWVVSKDDPRSVRLRSGYGEVATGLAAARRDRVAAGGQTEGRYQPTARSRRSYFVVARLPDGRIFQSYVKTADAGWQPGFDAVSSGRVSMGQASGAAAQALRSALPGTAPAAAPSSAAPAPPAAATPGADRTPAPGADTGADTGAALPVPLDTTGRTQRAIDSATAAAQRFADSLAGLPASAFDTVATARSTASLDDATLVAESAEERPLWPWLLGGLLAGALLAAAALWPVHQRRLDQQRDHLLRLVPDAEQRAALDAERAASLSAARVADTARFDRTMKQIDTLRSMLRDRDEEIRRLRTLQGDLPATRPPDPADPDAPAGP